MTLVEMPPAEPQIVAPDEIISAHVSERLRLLMVSIAGFCTFLDLYATQPLLPQLRHIFHASEAAVSLTVTATTLAVALAAPFAGALADRFGRKPVITAAIFGLTLPTLLAAVSAGLDQLIAFRFLQGLFMPGIFAVTMAYISEEWAEGGAGGAMAAYVTGNVLGGFTGRFVTGLIADHGSWRMAFEVLAVMNLLGGIAVLRWLPASRRFLRDANRGASLRNIAEHLRNPILIATFAAGFNVLFTQVATFTYITFYLSGAPFHLGTTALGSLFLVYLIGVVTTPIAGRWIDRAGHRVTFIVAMAASTAGILLTLIHALPAVVAGLALLCCGVFVCQSAGSSHVGVAARHARSVATGLYVSFYYIGGSVGASLPGLVWDRGGWFACVALVVLVQVLTAAIVWMFWPRKAAFHIIDAVS